MQKLKVAFFDAKGSGRFTSFLSAFRHADDRFLNHPAIEKKCASDQIGSFL